MHEKSPTVAEVRQLIEQVNKPEIRMCLKTAYLYAGRISEVIGRATPNDTTTARGPHGTDVRFDTIDDVEAALFTVYTAKRQGMERIVALPVKLEPWAAQIAEYFQTKGKELVFPFTRQYVSLHTHDTFSGLLYPIDRYKVVKNKLAIIRDKHWNPFRLHALRHLRTTELVRFYHFRADDLAAYCGWKLSTISRGISPVMERYIDLSWQEYWPKLLRPRQ